MTRFGQNFLADPNLLDAIVRDAELRPGDVVLEVGPGEGVLTERLAERAAQVHAIEIDRGLETGLEAVAALPNVSITWGDAMRVELAGLAPAPTAMVANLPYSVATPVLLRTIEELPSLRRWTVMVQREIADRLRAAPGSRIYGSPSVVAQLACEVKLVRSRTGVATE
jgi:16S rRNA (adenine1518-N6/adenine1519-N6)-dimethyltransferase